MSHSAKCHEHLTRLKQLKESLRKTGHRGPVDLYTCINSRGQGFEPRRRQNLLTIEKRKGKEAKMRVDFRRQNDQR